MTQPFRTPALTSPSLYLISANRLHPNRWSGQLPAGLLIRYDLTNRGEQPQSDTPTRSACYRTGSAFPDAAER